MSDLKKILGGDTEPTQPSEQKTPASANVDPKVQEEDQALKAKEEHAKNLDKAIFEGTETLRKIRQDAKKAKAGTLEDDEDDLPRINMDDPSSKAWDKHIRRNVDPFAQELEKEREEVQTFALREFLKEKPSLASNPEKLKAVMATYDRIKTSSGRTREGVMLDLDKAYAAEHHEELTELARRERVDGARNNAIFSDIAVSRGSTAYQEDRKVEKKVYSEEEKDILKQWERSGAPRMD